MARFRPARLVPVLLLGCGLLYVDAEGSAPVDDTEVKVDVPVHVEATAQGACHAAKEGAAAPGDGVPVLRGGGPGGEVRARR